MGKRVEPMEGKERRMSTQDIYSLEGQRDAWKRRAEQMKAGNESLERENLKLRARIDELSVALAAIGDMAVADYNVEVVGKVDALIDPQEVRIRYKHMLQQLFKSAERVM